MLKFGQNRQLKYFFLLLLLIPLTLLSQNVSGYGKISGNITDAQTNQPIENVNIYISNSLIGTSTNKDGEFLISKVPVGRYTLIISHISYLSQSERIEIFDNKNVGLTLRLLPKPIELPEIAVVDKYDDDWEDNFELFKKRFFGATDFANECKIENPHILTFEEKGNMLFASAEEPLKIINKSLGYEVTYFLKHFECDYDNTKYSGLPFFKELESSSANEQKEWENNRLRAYMGSLRHFLRSLGKYYELAKANKDTLKLNIEIGDITDDGVKYSYDKNMFLSKQGFNAYLLNYMHGPSGVKTISHPFYPDSVITESNNPNELNLVCGQTIQVNYFKEYHALTYQPQISNIVSHSYLVYFDKQGRYFDEYKLQTFGNFAKQGVAEMVPFEYEPSDSLLMNTDFR